MALITSSLSYQSGLTTTTTTTTTTTVTATARAPASQAASAAARGEPLCMARLLSNLIDAMASPPSSLTAPPAPSAPPPPLYAAAAPYHRDDASSSPATSSSLSITCCRCEERPPTTRCVDCNDLYCHECCHALTSDCQLRDHALTPLKQVSPIGVRAQMSPIGVRAGAAVGSHAVAISDAEKELHCDVHSEPIRFYCGPCTSLICQDCTLWMHKDHKYTPIHGPLGNCRFNMLRAVQNGKCGTKAIKGAIDRAVAISKSFEKDSVEVSLKIRRAMRYFIQAIEDREKYLLEKVEKIRQYKLNELSDQMNALRGVLAGVAHTNETLINCLDLEGIDLFLAKEKGLAQLDYFANMFMRLQPQDETISFVPPNYDLIDQLKRQCDVVPSSANAKSSLQGSGYQLALPMSGGGGGAGAGATSADFSRAINPRFVSYYDNNHSVATLDMTPQRGIGQAIAGYWLPVSLKPTRDPTPGVPVLSFAREGQNDGQVSRPWGLCVDRDGNIIVADRRNNRIQIFTKEGRFHSAFGSKGSGAGEFDLPAGITTDNYGRIIVIDKDNHRVQIFTPTGQFILKFGSCGKECGQFQYPWDVAVNTLGNIAVTDTRNHRIQLFTRDGTYITKFAFETVNPAKTLKGPTTPRGICFTSGGHLIVSDFENHRLIMIEGTLSRVICTVGREGSGNGELNRPSGIVTDDEGRLIVADSKNHRVMVFSADLRYQWAVDVKSPGLDDKDRPSDVALTPEGYLVVLFETLPDTARDIVSHGKEYIKVY